jgi:uncharacterized membrane protein YagU involved in acid resistance
MESVRGSDFWKSALYAGVIGGAVFMMAEMLMVMLIGESPWAPPRMIAAMALGMDVLPSAAAPATFDVAILMTAMMIHFPLAIVYGFAVGWIVQRMSQGQAALTGAVIGLVIYVVNFYVIASFAFTWFAMARNAVSAITHILFGLVAAWAFAALAQTRPPTTAR